MDKFTVLDCVSAALLKTQLFFIHAPEAVVVFTAPTTVVRIVHGTGGSHHI